MSYIEIIEEFKKEYPKEYKIKFEEGPKASGWFRTFEIWDAFYKGFSRAYDKYSRR